MKKGQALLSTQPAEARERRFALAVVLVSCLLFLVAAPFARNPLPQEPVFIAVYQSTLAVSDLMTMALLLGQFNWTRSRGLLVLSAGYLFTALIAIVHATSFPGLLAPGGVLGGGAQSTAWLYMFWHAVFPLTVLYYALHRNDKPVAGRTSVAMLLSWAIVVALLAVLVRLATHGEALLPAVMDGNHYTPAMLGVVGSVWLCSMAALGALWRRKPHSVLDLWLMVVMCAWLFDIALSAVLNGGRYDMGFYVGRLYGLGAASFVLVVLLLETFALYGRLAAANDLLQDLAHRDGLTGIFNRRHLDHYLEVELARCQREQQLISLLMIDIDHFKKFNDHYGHQDGDACLRAVATVIADMVKRPGDLVARYGGEEFAVVLPGTHAKGAAVIAQQIRAKVNKVAMTHAVSPIGHVTLSIGIATQHATALADAGELVALADGALYQAKAAGRDCVITSVIGPQ